VAGRALQASEHRLLLASGDLITACAAVAVSMWIWSITAGFPFTLGFVTGHAAWFLAAPAWLLVLLPSHNVRTALSVRRTVAALVRGMAVLLTAYLAVYFYLPPRALPRLVALYILWEGALLVLAWRLWYLWFFSRCAYLRRVLVVGSGDRADTAIRLLNETQPAMTIVGRENDLPPDAGPDGLLNRVETSGAADIVLAAQGQPDDRLLDALLHCQERGVRVIGFAQLYEETLQRVPVDHVDREWLLSSFAEAIQARDASRLIKRVFDLAGAAIGLCMLLIAAPVIAAAIALEDGRPIFFRQARVGLAGAIFHIVKFRTMVRGAEDRDGPRWASAGDPRVTRAGRVLRRARLDELPNLVNVLRGEMSLIGPRPERPELVAMLEQQVPFYRTRLMVRPGLTGWAQVNRPYSDTVAGASEKLEYDLYYLKHRTLGFDLWILLRTVGTVLGLKGR
jgi:exopolysaccharide biosynthesis polyprenyl glycosylphosphotransferase